MLVPILVILLILWLAGGAPQLAGNSGFGGNGIHFIWVIIVILLILMLLGYRI